MPKEQNPARLPNPYLPREPKEKPKPDAKKPAKK